MGEGKRDGPHAHANWRRAWLVVGLAAWAEIGVGLVDRANQQGLVEDITISPYHVVAYAALLALAVYASLTFFRGLRRGHWRDAFPPHYGGLGLGLAFLAVWIVLDIAWRNTIGINRGIEEGLSPPRLLIPVALVIIASGPLRDAIAARAGELEDAVAAELAGAEASAERGARAEETDLHAHLRDPQDVRGLDDR